MSAASASWRPPAAASCNTPGSARPASVASKPACARNPNPSAACAAENEVVAPRSLAMAVSATISASVAPLTAATRFMPCSKPRKDFAASAPTATSGAVRPTESDRPAADARLPKRSNERCVRPRYFAALPMSFSNRAMFAESSTRRAPIVVAMI